MTYLKTCGLATIGVMMATVINVADASCSDKRAPGVDWSGCKKSRKMLDEEDFSGARFDGANFSASTMDGSNFSKASLVKADLTRASLSKANFERRTSVSQ